MVKKYIKTTINTTLYLKEHLKFACGHGGGGWSEGLQTVGPGEVVEGCYLKSDGKLINVNGCDSTQ